MMPLWWLLQSVYKWSELCKSENKAIKDEQHLERFSTSKTDKNMQKSGKNVSIKQTARKFAEKLNISYGFLQIISLHNLQMRRGEFWVVCRFSTDEQKQNLVLVCTEFKAPFDANPDFTVKVITEDESYMYGYDLEMKMLSSQWKGALFFVPKSHAN